MLPHIDEPLTARLQTLHVLPSTLAASAALLALAAAVPAPAGSATPAPAAAPAVPSPSPVRVPDTLAQRVLACTACHGQEGRSAPDAYYPRIAGKPAGYLYNQLLNFRERRRHYGPMNWMVDPLSEDYLREIAEHFASLDVPHPAPVDGPATPALLEQGRRLVREGDRARDLPACASCHGDAMMGAQPFIPGLLGLPRDYVNAQFGAWRTGLRRAHAPDCMAQVAKRLTVEDIAAVSTWLAAQPVPPGAGPAPRAATPLPMDCGGAGP